MVLLLAISAQVFLTLVHVVRDCLSICVEAHVFPHVLHSIHVMLRGVFVLRRISELEMELRLAEEKACEAGGLRDLLLTNFSSLTGSITALQQSQAQSKGAILPSKSVRLHF